MSSAKPIGGYFGLELSGDNFVPADAVLLASGRACFEYVLKANKAKHVYLPKFTCDVMLQPLKKLGIPYTFYQLTEALEIAELPTPKPGEFVVYTNYFGIKDDYCRQMEEHYGAQLILDCSQAFYYEHSSACHTFYSPRKFFGLPDGGILYANKTLSEELPVDESYKRFAHLLKRLDIGPEAGYEDFKADDADLDNRPLAQMSNLTRQLLGAIDFATAKEKRNANYKVLHQKLGASNLLPVPNAPEGALYYPYRTDKADLRKKLIANSVFVPTYWPNVFEWCKPDELEYQLSQQIIPLPIDQRYDAADMQTIIDLIGENS